MAALFDSDDRTAKAELKLIDWTNRCRVPVVAADRGSRDRAPPAHAGPARHPRRGRRHAQVHGGALRPRRRDRAHAVPFRADRRGIRSLDEHWDGRGMPDGLRGEEIPLAARILASPRRSRCFTPPAAWRQHAAWPSAGAGAGSIPAWSTPSCASAATAILGRARVTRRLRVGAPDLALAGDDERLDRIAQAFARVIDAKSPFTAPAFRARGGDRRRDRRCSSASTR